MYSVISSYEASTCAGGTFSDLWEACLGGKSFISDDGLGKVQDPNYTEVGNPVTPLIACIKRALNNNPSKKWLDTPNQIGIILATTTGHTASWESPLMDFVSSETPDTQKFAHAFSREPLGLLLEEVKAELKISGPSTVVSTACSASTHALGIAHTWLKIKKVEKCLVISTELLCLLTTKGFASFNLLSPSPCKPFDKNRAGINLSEAFACICLESKESITKEEIHIAGFGASTDTFQMTTPDPEGKGTAASISMALKNAATSSTEVDMLHAHGTASHYNDLAESEAFKNIWPNETMRPLLLSTKGTHGHALGASGLIETCIIAKAMTENICPPTTGFKDEDSRLGLSPTKKLIKKPLFVVVKNTLGFGGANASLVFKKGPFHD